MGENASVRVESVLKEPLLCILYRGCRTQGLQNCQRLNYFNLNVQLQLKVQLVH